jgi:hypothetical protein
MLPILPICLLFTHSLPILPVLRILPICAAGGLACLCLTKMHSKYVPVLYGPR